MLVVSVGVDFAAVHVVPPFHESCDAHLGVAARAVDAGIDPHLDALHAGARQAR